MVVIAIIAILAAILFPVFARAKDAAHRATCTSNLRQIGLIMTLYAADYDDRMPDRRDLKTSLPGGFRPWTTWPPSDPRAGWFEVVGAPYRKSGSLRCPSVNARMRTLVQVNQPTGTPGEFSNIWMWRFDRPDFPIPLDNFWGKSEDQAVSDLISSGNLTVGQPNGPADVELAVDPYFPRTIPTVASGLRGLAVHAGGRNRLFLDGHVAWLRDIRTNG